MACMSLPGIQQEADTLWTHTCGKERWLGRLDELCSSIERVNDGDLWSFRASQRQALIRYARHRLVRQMQMRGAARDHIHRPDTSLIPMRSPLALPDGLRSTSVPLSCCMMQIGWRGCCVIPNVPYS